MNRAVWIALSFAIFHNQIFSTEIQASEVTPRSLVLLGRAADGQLEGMRGTCIETTRSHFSCEFSISRIEIPSSTGVEQRDSTDEIAKAISTLQKTCTKEGIVTWNSHNVSNDFESYKQLQVSNHQQACDCISSTPEKVTECATQWRARILDLLQNRCTVAARTVLFGDLIEAPKGELTGQLKNSFSTYCGTHFPARLWIGNSVDNGLVGITKAEFDIAGAKSGHKNCPSPKKNWKIFNGKNTGSAFIPSCKVIQLWD